MRRSFAPEDLASWSGLACFRDAILWLNSCTYPVTHLTTGALFRTESIVKAQIPTPPIVLILGMAVMLGLAACSPAEAPPRSAAPAAADDYTVETSDRLQSAGEQSSETVEVLSSVSRNPAPAREGMVAFEGNVFVATSELHTDLWQSAGWSIGQDPVSIDPVDMPADCTLYPHAGVKNQWVGRCRGYILIPQAGARDIAVLLTDDSGGTTVVQVAPAPTGVQP
jgi:hypothetical protein